MFNDSALSLIGSSRRPRDTAARARCAIATRDFAAHRAGVGIPSRRVADERRELAALRSTAPSARPGPYLIDAVVDPSGYAAVLAATRGAR